jgi:Protein of unknown function (DUF3500)
MGLHRGRLFRARVRVIRRPPERPSHQARVILVEFDHQSGIVFDNDTPSRDHIHTVVRTPNGNDYGKDLLRQHYAEHDHSHPGTAHRQGRT